MIGMKPHNINEKNQHIILERIKKGLYEDDGEKEEV